MNPPRFKILSRPGIATVPVAVFGVSPNTSASRYFPRFKILS